jgi:hypothetical protein
MYVTFATNVLFKPKSTIAVLTTTELWRCSKLPTLSVFRYLPLLLAIKMRTSIRYFYSLSPQRFLDLLVRVRLLLLPVGAQLSPDHHHPPPGLDLDGSPDFQILPFFGSNLQLALLVA